MGANEFSTRAKGKTANEAFSSAVEQARYEDGHGGYTGTIAEKSNFKMVYPRDGESPLDCVERCMEDDNHFSQDKWGPAGCVLKEEGKDGLNTYIFFGWASS